MSRIIAGKLRLEPRRSTCRTVAGSASPSSPRRWRKRWRSHRYPPGSLTVTATARGCSRWSGTCCHNAIKFTPDGRPRRSSASRGIERPDLAVSRHRHGHRAEFLPHVFEPFRQAEHTHPARTAASASAWPSSAHRRASRRQRQRRKRGRRQGRDVHGGSSPRPPAAAHGARPWTSAARAWERRPGGLDGVRVLIVNDDADCRELFAAILARAARRGDRRRGPLVRLSAARRARPDVIVCDIAMPGDDGFTLIREVRCVAARRGAARCRRSPLTAYARPEDRERRSRPVPGVPVEARGAARLLEAVARLVLGLPGGPAESASSGR